MATPRISVDLLNEEEEKFKAIMKCFVTKGMRIGRARTETIRYMIEKCYEA